MDVPLVVESSSSVTHATIVLTDNEHFKRLTAQSIVIAAGGEPFVPPIPGLKAAGYLTSETVWSIRDCRCVSGSRARAATCRRPHGSPAASTGCLRRAACRRA